MHKRLGIMGCGQLSQMLGEAARRLGAKVSYLCVDETPVVSGLGDIYSPDNADAFFDQCDAITVERESLPDALLQRARDETQLAPGYNALVVLRQRDTQKAMLDRLEIPTSPWGVATTSEELADVLVTLPSDYSRCKRILGGYDGGGQWRVQSHSLDQIPVEGYPLIAEAEITIDRELAIIIARDTFGDSVCYPITENVMRQGILIGSHVPASVTPEQQRLAETYARRLVDAMDYVGVLAIEFFVTDGRLIVNEIAPRVHNTGHWTMGAVGADQFIQHVSVVLGGAVTEPVFNQAAAMVNLLNAPLPARMPEGPIRVLMQTYGKGVRPGRKLGHLTLIGPDAGAVRLEANQYIAELHGVVD